MDSATATVIAAAISALASIAVAFITTRARIGVPALPLGDGPIIPESVPHGRSVKRTAFRTVGWVLVGLLYLMAAGLLYLGFVDGPRWLYYVEPHTAADITSISLTCIAGVFFVVIAFWAQRRLQRSRRKISDTTEVGSVPVCNSEVA
jgi:hypothetical protein